MQINFLMSGCCLSGYDPKTGSCGVCGFCYDRQAWSAHLLRVAESTNQRLGLAPAPKLATRPEAVTLTVEPPRTAVNPVVGDRRCLRCGEDFEVRRSTATFCSSTCRVAYHRERKRRQARDCPKCNKRNGRLLPHSCESELALDRVYNSLAYRR